MTAERWVVTAGGIAVLVFTWAVWTGRWKQPGYQLINPNVAWTAAPSSALLLLGYGLEPVFGSAAWLPVGVVFFPAFVLLVWQPDWFGPRWWRERDKNDLHQEHGPNAALLHFIKPDLGPYGSLAVLEAEMAPEEPQARMRAKLVTTRYGRPSAAQREGLVDGHVLVYARGVAFAATRLEDKMREEPVIEQVAASVIAGVERDGGRRVRVRTIQGGAWTLETRRAEALHAELARRFGHEQVASAPASGG